MKCLERLAAIDASTPRMEHLLPGTPNRALTLMRLMHALNQSQNTYLDHVLRPSGLSESELTSLFLLFQSNDGAATAGMLCDLAGYTKASMTRILSELSEKKYIVRSSDTRDGRRQLIRMTPKGKSVVKDLHAAITGPLALAVAGITVEEMGALEGLLRRFASSLDKAERQMQASFK